MSAAATAPPSKSDQILEALAGFRAEVAEVKKMAQTPADGAGADAINKAYRTPAVARDPDEEGRHGFKSLTHFCHDIWAAETGSKEVSPVLKSWNQVVKAASGLNELVGSEGGFLVPPTFSNELLKRTYDNDLLSRTRSSTTTGNDMTWPAIDETSRADGSRFGGVRMYWDAEAAQYTSSKPAYNKIELKLKKLTGLAYVTDEMIQDSGTAMESHLFDLFSQETAFKMGDAIVNGSGAGMPQGILNSGCLVSVSKETGQAAATLLFENINKMWQRMYAPSRMNAVWLINQDIEAALDGLAINVGTGGLPVYLPPGGLSEKPYATLKGRPVMPVEFCATLGTVGDIILVDLSQYLTLRKGEATQATSIHFKFDTGEQAFRITFRADGRMWWTSALTPFKGSNTLSPVVALATRS
jgi:HK97 family phage major capsid protein